MHSVLRTKCIEVGNRRMQQTIHNTWYHISFFQVVEIQGIHKIEPVHLETEGSSKMR